jgi:hypothetical protein
MSHRAPYISKGHDIDQHGEGETGTLEQAALNRNGMYKSVTFIT